MDKETLSNYGWIVICVLVLAVMIALAGPFGTFVAGAVKSTTAGLFGVNQNALGAAGIEIGDQAFDEGENGGNGGTGEEGNTIASNGVYYVDVSGTAVGDYTGAKATYTAGQEFPETVTTGDVYVCGDYEYRYNQYYLSGWATNSGQNGWGVRVLDANKTTYGAILESINGEPVVNLYRTFNGCANLTTAPSIPSGVTNMWATFWGCTSLSTYVGNTDGEGNFTNYVIPNGVTFMTQTFYNCTSMVSAPVIPVNVTRLSGTFQGCTSLTGTVTINVSATLNGGPEYQSCFSGTVKPIIIAGSSNASTKNILASTATNGNVTVQ